MVVVEVLPLHQLGVEATDVFYDHALQHAIGFLFIDAVRAFNFTVEARCPGLDITVRNAQILHIPVELGVELTPIICLNGTRNGKREST